MRLQLQKCFNCPVLQDEPRFTELLGNTWIILTADCWTTGCMKGFWFLRTQMHFFFLNKCIHYSADLHCLQLLKENCCQILGNINVPGVLLVSKWELAHTGGCTLNGLKRTIISGFFKMCWNPDSKVYGFLFLSSKGQDHRTLLEDATLVAKQQNPSEMACSHNEHSITSSSFFVVFPFFPSPHPSPPGSCWQSIWPTQPCHPFSLSVLATDLGTHCCLRAGTTCGQSVCDTGKGPAVLDGSQSRPHGQRSRVQTSWSVGGGYPSLQTLLYLNRHSFKGKYDIFGCGGPSGILNLIFNPSLFCNTFILTLWINR